MILFYSELQSVSKLLALSASAQIVDWATQQSPVKQRSLKEAHTLRLIISGEAHDQTRETKFGRHQKIRVLGILLQNYIHLKQLVFERQEIWLVIGMHYTMRQTF